MSGQMHNAAAMCEIGAQPSAKRSIQAALYVKDEIHKKTSLNINSKIISFIIYVLYILKYISRGRFHYNKAVA